MNHDQQLAVTIEHELPGRLRIRLSHALRQPERIRRLVTEHAGIGEVQYTAVTRSVLVRYDPQHISTEEIVIRIATGLSLEHDNAAIRVLTRPPTRELTDSAFYSGVAVLAALALRLTGRSAAASAALDRIAGLTTAGAALHHGWVDYRLRGNFDPEVLSVTYLLTALLGGNALPATIFTWISTFGRHLVRLPTPGVEVRPAQIGRDSTSHFEVVVAPDRTPPDKMTFFGMIPTMLFHAITGRTPGQHASLIEDIRRVAQMHDQVLEGASGFQRGIPLRIRGAINGFAE
ncbi:MAG: hypothetical protein ACLP3R_20835 [Candidatus Korobacteraceae bacterium]